MIKDIDGLHMYFASKGWGVIVSKPCAEDDILFISVRSVIPPTGAHDIRFRTELLPRKTTNIKDANIGKLIEPIRGMFMVNIIPETWTPKGIFKALEDCGFVKGVSDELDTIDRCSENIKNQHKYVVMSFHDGLFETVRETDAYIEKVSKFAMSQGLPERGFEIRGLEYTLEKRKHLIKMVSIISRAENVLIILPSDNYIDDKISEKMRENYGLLIRLLDAFDHVHCEVLTVEPD